MPATFAPKTRYINYSHRPDDPIAGAQASFTPELEDAYVRGKLSKGQALEGYLARDSITVWEAIRSAQTFTVKDNAGLPGSVPCRLIEAVNKDYGTYKLWLDHEKSRAHAQKLKCIKAKATLSRSRELGRTGGHQT